MHSSLSDYKSDELVRRRLDSICNAVDWRLIFDLRTCARELVEYLDRPSYRESSQIQSPELETVTELNLEAYMTQMRMRSVCRK